MQMEESRTEFDGLGGTGIYFSEEAEDELTVDVRKKAAVGVGARILFYPTLLYNLIRNKLEPQFHWWDQVDEFVLLGAVPFPSDAVRLKGLGVSAVVTLNEPYETLVHPSFYHALGMENLVLPTRDYLYAPSIGNLCTAVEFIHKNASSGNITYVHCKAGRGRSTTVVLCYLVRYKNMTPSEAFEYVRIRRPRILLASSQWLAIQQFYHHTVKKSETSMVAMDNEVIRSRCLVNNTCNLIAFNDNTFVVISESDLDGYSGDPFSSTTGNKLWAELRLVYRVQFVSKAATFARLSYFWFACPSRKL